MYIELWAAEYTPEEGGECHWALHLWSSSENRAAIYQIVGEPTAYTYGHRDNGDLATCGSLIQIVFVSEIEQHDVKFVTEILKMVPIRNDTATWDSQDWVLEALKRLNDEKLIDEPSYFCAEDQLRFAMDRFLD